MRRSSSPTLAVAILVVASWLMGCSNGSGPLFPTAPPDPLAGMPAQNSPTNAVRAFDWVWVNKSSAGYRLLLTNDFVFAFAATDTAGNRYRDLPWTRADEFTAFDNLATDAQTIELVLDKSFAVFDDTRPGIGDPAKHKTIRTQVLLNITTRGGNQTNVQGKANLFLERGDVAMIPPDTGLRPDSTRWYIQRWEDETFAGVAPGFRIAPSQSKTWGSVKLQYRWPAQTASNGIRR